MNTRFSKTLIVLAMAGLLGSGAALAGNGPGDGVCDGSGDGVCTGDGNGDGNGGSAQRRGGPAERMAGMANRLGLTLEQQIRALELFDAHQQEQLQIRARIFADYGEEICAQRELHRQEFLALLTDEQLALHEELQQRRAQRGGGHRAGPGGFECPVDDSDD